MNKMVAILAVFVLIATTSAFNIQDINESSKWLKDIGYDGQLPKTTAKLRNGQTNIMYRYDGKVEANVLQLNAVPSAGAEVSKHPKCGPTTGISLGENSEIFCGPSALRLKISDIGQGKKTGLALLVENDTPKVLTLALLFKSQFAADIMVKIPIFKTLEQPAESSLAASEELQKITNLCEDSRVKPSLQFKWLEGLLKEGVYLSTGEKVNTYISYPLALKSSLLDKLVRVVKKLSG